MTLIFPHIPKCGGTSVRSFLEESNLQLYWDYDAPPHPVQYLAARAARRNHEHSLLDFSNFDVVFGHFPLKRYMSDKYEVVCLLREPYSRLVSHYNFWKYVVGDEAICRNPIIQEIRENRVDIVEFAERMEMHAFYKLYLDYKTEGFLYVGFTDHINFFLEDLARYLSISLSSFRSANINVKKDSVSCAQEKKLKTMLQDELDYFLLMRSKYLSVS